MTGLKVLVAEDTPGLRAVLRSVMESWGYQVIEAEDGAQAVEAANREQPDLALLDLEMPKLDGTQALAGIGRVSPGTVCVLMTGCDRRSKLAAARRSGARALLRARYGAAVESPMYVLAGGFIAGAALTGFASATLAMERKGV